MSAASGEIRPEHLLRALLDDRLVRDLLAAAGTDADELRAVLEREYLAGLEVIDEASLYAARVDLTGMLATWNAPRVAPGPFAAAMDAYRLTDGARACLMRGVGEAARTGATTMTSGHLLLGLLRTRDRTVARVLRTVRVDQRAVRTVLRRWGRRAGGA